MITNGSNNMPDGKRLETLQAVLNRYCLSLTKSNWEAQDLAQDTWVKAISQLKDTGHSNPEALLLRIAKNTWIDLTRRKAVLSQILKREQQKVTVLTEHDPFKVETAFQALIKHLSPLQRTVFLLRDVFGYSVAEVTEMLETTEGAVKAALHRARQGLHAVKEDLETGVFTARQEKGSKVFLRVLASSYERGDISRVVELVQLDEADAAAIGGAHNKSLGNLLQIRRSSNQSEMRMAA